MTKKKISILFIVSLVLTVFAAFFSYIFLDTSFHLKESVGFDMLGLAFLGPIVAIFFFLSSLGTFFTAPNKYMKIASGLIVLLSIVSFGLQYINFKEQVLINSQLYKTDTGIRINEQIN